MVAAMQSSIARMDLGRSFLSLRKGLDTRAILAAFVMQDKLLPAFTISGSSPTLDAMRVRQLRSAYGFPHTLVSIDQCIEGRLPEYTVRASRYSGGLNSIEQVIELYFYELAGPGYTGRLSGNLGNQVGSPALKESVSTTHRRHLLAVAWTSICRHGITVTGSSRKIRTRTFYLHIS
jgi:hypothetical protein